MTGTDDAERFTNPNVLREIVELLGQDAMDKLIAAHGGAKIYIPRRHAETSLIARTIGADGARKIGEVFGGMTIHVPATSSSERGARNSQVIEMRRSGATIRQICHKFRLTERTVFRILRPAE